MPKKYLNIYRESPTERKIYLHTGNPNKFFGITIFDS
jgi:hypothetical protein